MQGKTPCNANISNAHQNYTYQNTIIQVIHNKSCISNLNNIYQVKHISNHIYINPCKSKPYISNHTYHILSYISKNAYHKLYIYNHTYQACISNNICQNKIIHIKSKSDHTFQNMHIKSNISNQIVSIYLIITTYQVIHVKSGSYI